MKHTVNTRVPHIQILGCSSTWIPIHSVTGNQSTTSTVVTTSLNFVVRTTRVAWGCSNWTTGTHTSWGSSVVGALDSDHITSWTWYCSRVVFAKDFSVCSAWEWTVLDMSSYMIIQKLNNFSHQNFGIVNQKFQFPMRDNPLTTPLLFHNSGIMQPSDPKMNLISSRHYFETPWQISDQTVQRLPRKTRTDTHTHREI